MNELYQLKLFISRANELKNKRAIRNGFNTQLKINWDKEKGFITEITQPDEDDLRSFLLLLRQFISDKEPIFLNRIYNLCYKYIDDDDIKSGLIKAREVWKQSQINSGMGLILENDDFTPEYSTDLWINGYYFHNDEEKRKIIESKLHLEQIFIRHQFLNYIISATENIFYVSRMIEYAIEKGKLL